MNFKQNFTELCSLWSNWQYDSIDSDIGLAQNRRQAIIWSNVGMLYWRIYAPLSLNEVRLRESLPGNAVNNHIDGLMQERRTVQ